MKKPSFKLWFVVGVMLALSATYWAGCSKTPNEPAIQETTLNATSPQAIAVMTVQDRYTDNLLAHPEVVGTATGLTEDGKPAILVLTKSDIKQKADVRVEFLKKGVAPVAIPATIEDIPVVVMVTGEIKALKGGPPGGGNDPTARQSRPVPIGVSTGHPAITAGTISCRVKKGGNVYALSNNHVYAATNFLECTPTSGYGCAIGDNVLQPGTYDGGVNPGDAIGTVNDFEPISFSSSNTIDAAIALSSTANLGNATLSDGYGVPKSQTTSASLNMNVMKYGRTTGLTTGKVQGINASVNVNYGDPGVALFVGQIVIGGGGFSSGGDSGSLIVVNDVNKRTGVEGPDHRKPVGLLFAGGGGSTIANPIGAVLSRFGVTIDGQQP